MLEDRPGPDEPDAGDDLGGDAGGIDRCAGEPVGGDDGEECRSQRHKRMRPKTGGLAMQLALEPDDRPKDEAEHQATGELELEVEAELGGQRATSSPCMDASSPVADSSSDHHAEIQAWSNPATRTRTSQIVTKPSSSGRAAGSTGPALARSASMRDHTMRRTPIASRTAIRSAKVPTSASPMRRAGRVSRSRRPPTSEAHRIGGGSASPRRTQRT